MKKKGQRKKAFRKHLTKVVVESEKAMYKGKKIMVVIIIPLIEILANVLTLMDEDDDKNEK